MADDNEVIQRVLAGETEAFRLLVQRYQRPVLSLARNLLMDQHAGEDAAQDAFVSAYQHLRDFDPRRARFPTWLFTIARNKCLNALRAPRLASLPDGPSRVDPRQPRDQAQEDEMFEELDRALAKLPPEQRSAFVQAELMDLTCQQIATIEAVPAGTIRSRVSRARAALQESLKHYVGGGS